MVFHQYFGALRTAIVATPLGAHGVYVCGRDAVPERELIVPRGVGDGGCHAHLFRRVIRFVENDGHSNHMCATAARKLSGDREGAPNELFWGGHSGGDGRRRYPSLFAPLHKTSFEGAVRSSGSISACEKIFLPGYMSALA
jgi:hypothetical protein